MRNGGKTKTYRSMRGIPMSGMDFQGRKKLLNFLIWNFYRAIVEVTEAEVIFTEIS